MGKLNENTCIAPKILFLLHTYMSTFTLPKTPMGIHVILGKPIIRNVAHDRHTTKASNTFPSPSHCNWFRAGHIMEPEAWYIRTKVLSTSGWQDLQTWYLELLRLCLLSQGGWSEEENTTWRRAGQESIWEENTCRRALMTSHISGSNCTWSPPHSPQVFSQGSQLIHCIV